MKKDELIGKKIYGFKFESRKYNSLLYEPKMDSLIGEIGRITDYIPFYDSYEVEFKNEFWSYPYELIEQHIVKDEIPELLDGMLMWVSDDEDFSIKNKAFVFGKKNGKYLAWSDTLKNDLKSRYVIHWNYAKLIEENKKKVELTIDEIAERFGVDKKYIKIVI